MLLKKGGFPEDSELVMCTVSKVQPYSVFVNLDEYGKTGMIHISEVSPGRIRNIRDYVKEGKKIVCKVLRVNKERGHIDLSLRRVTETQKRIKIDEIKQEQKAEKIIEIVAKGLKADIKGFFNDVSGKILGKYDSIYACFQDVVSKDKVLESLGIEKKHAKALEDAVRQRIKEAVVEIEGKLRLSTYAVNGIDVVKEALNKAGQLGKDSIDIMYLGGGNYNVIVKAPDYKQAEKILEKATEKAIEFVEKNEGFGEFVRVER